MRHVFSATIELMKRTLTIAAVLTMMFGGAAYAGRGRGGGHGGGRGNSQGGVVVRDHRGPAPVYRGGPGRARYSGGGHVRVTNGRYVFPGGVVRVYNRPVHRVRYYNRTVRPALIIEQYDPVPGYVWVAGGWNWGGAEWIWTPGYWAVAAEPAPVVSGGISVSAGISIR
jgi:hypothetical protein